MLRTILLCCGGLLFAGGVAACVLTATPAGVSAIVLGLAIAIGLLVERRGYKPIRDEVPGPDWQNTGETFLGPGSGVPVVVYFQPSTGERAYVRAGNTG